MRIPRALGDGAVVDAVDVEDSSELESLRTENRQLRRQLSDAEVRAERAGEDADRALSALRRQLNPLYRALQAVYGELDAAGVTDMPAADTQSSRGVDPRWALWKSKMPGRPSELIDLLLLHGEMSRNQLMAAMRAGKDVVRVTTSRLNVAGLLVKNGGKFSLKSLS